MSSFKVRLRVPSGSASSAPVAKEASPASSQHEHDGEVEAAPESGDVSMPSEVGGGTSEDELADESMAADGSPDVSVDSVDPKSKKGSAKQRRAVHAPGSISAVAATLTLEELDALPSAKRRKGLKTRGAPGPGRGWRKGLSKGQKPVYRLPGSGLSTADLPQNLAVQATTPPTFAGKGGAESPRTSSPAPRRPKNSSSSAASAAKPSSPAPSSSLASSSVKVAQNTPDTVFKYPAIPSSKDTPDILPLARIPNYIPTIPPLERAPSKKARHWEHGTREILSIGGRPWRTSAWVSKQPKEAPTDAQKETEAGGTESSQAPSHSPAHASPAPQAASPA